MADAKTSTILMVEDDPPLAEVYKAYLARHPYEVVHVETGGDALKYLGDHVPDALILDLHLPDMNGMSILQHIQDRQMPVPVVVITAHGSVNVAVEAMRLGAADFLMKPFTGERLTTTLRLALERQQLTEIVDDLKDDFDRHAYAGFIGSSLAMQRVYRIIDSAAPSKATIFVTGESGTGKEVCALAIHEKSPRRERPFMALNCGAIPGELMESEIFGHMRGAFTGAHADREGAAAAADGGTLFLDEICEMDLALQVKLLRFVQTGTYQRVGSTETEKVDVRFVCATNKEPWIEVEAGRFREDLYFRLNVIPMELPPLRDRDADVLELAVHFLAEYAAEEGKGFQRFDETAQEAILGHVWPGNVRQVQNVIRNAVVLNDGEAVSADMLPDLPVSGVERKPAKTAQAPAATLDGIRPMAEIEREVILGAIETCAGNVPRAAALLELSPSTVYRRLREWGADD